MPAREQPPPFVRRPNSYAAATPAGWLREQRWLGSPWRWGSILRRLWLRTRPTAARIAEIIDAESIDLVHLNDALPLAEPGILAARRRSRPSIVTVRSFTALDDFHRWISRWAAAAGIFTSRPLQQEQRAQGVRFRKERIIPNAIDLRQFQIAPDPAGVRAEFGIELDAQLVIVVGRIMQRKGLDVFIQAMAQVVQVYPQVHGLIVGEVEITDEGLDRALQNLAGDLGIANHIHFSGFRADVPRLLLASNLLVFVPTEPEPFGRILIEGMAAALPVIGARSGAIPDILIEDETGLLVPPADVDAQAAAIQQLLADPALAQRMGAAGRRHVAHHFSIDHQVQQLCELYEEVLAV